MKKILIIAIFFCSQAVYANTGKTTDHKFSVRNYADTVEYPESHLRTLNTPDYLNRPINDFLAFLDVAAPGYIVSRVFGYHGMRLATAIDIYYKNGLNFTIKVREFTHMQRYNENNEWDVNLFREEKADLIEFHKDGVCITGCPVD